MFRRGDRPRRQGQEAAPKTGRLVLTPLQPDLDSDRLALYARDAEAKIAALDAIVDFTDRNAAKEKVETAFWYVTFYDDLASRESARSVLAPRFAALRDAAFRANAAYVDSGEDAVVFAKRVRFFDASAWRTRALELLGAWGKNEAVLRFRTQELDAEASRPVSTLRLELALDDEFWSNQPYQGFKVHFEIDGRSLPDYEYPVCLTHTVPGLKTTATLIDLRANAHVGKRKESLCSCDDTVPDYCFEVDETDDRIVWFSMEETPGSDVLDDEWRDRRVALSRSSFVEQANKLVRDFDTALASGRLVVEHGQVVRPSRP